VLFLIAGCASPIELPEPEEPLQISDYPEDLSGSEHFDRYTTAFGVYVLATDTVPDDKLNHAARVLASYLDNNEDGEPDEDVVVEAMQRRDATLVMFGSEREARRVFRSGLLDGLHAQDLYADETAPSGGFDASLEEVLHLVTSAGYAHAWPDEFGESDSALTEAMDTARGGHFTSIPSNYPASAWYHYDDETCGYRCMSAEYIYWSLTSLLGAQSGRCAEIDGEWELCTPEQVREKDTAVTALLEESGHVLPTTLPDGNYIR
jgi:hypothetical protein